MLYDQHHRIVRALSVPGQDLLCEALRGGTRHRLLLEAAGHAVGRKDQGVATGDRKADARSGGSWRPTTPPRWTSNSLAMPGRARNKTPVTFPTPSHVRTPRPRSMLATLMTTPRVSRNLA